MKKKFVRAIQLLIAAAFFVFARDGALQAQTYPDRPIRMISNGNPGGVIDLMAQIAAKHLSPRLRIAVVVDSRGGASGIIGTQAVVSATPDGYTLLFSGVDGMDILPTPIKQLPYDPAKDLIPIAQITQVDVVLAVGAHVQANSVKELVGLAKANPGKLTFASTGTGSMNHMAGELLKLKAGIDMLHVPYKGSNPAVTDALGGRVDVVFTGVATAVGHVKTGGLKVLAVAGAHRSTMMPDVPTMEESGYPGFFAGSWFGVLAPAGTPAPIVDKLADELEKMANSPEYLTNVSSIGSEKEILLKENFARSIATEREHWHDVAKQVNIKFDAN
jgi:tripartite-type tricarboxylate transporter receptor subunit TctC